MKKNAHVLIFVIIAFVSADKIIGQSGVNTNWNFNPSRNNKTV